jgi:signal transduction histidine kinase
MGRFAEQMAHDLRNPVAAIRGAAQFLQEEHAQGRSMDEHVQFIELIVERTQRLERVIAEYQRIGRVEPRLEAIDVDVLVRDLVASEPWGEGVSVECALDEGLPAASADRDLLCHALENLLRNACEAMPDGGKLEVRCERVAESDSVRITVADDGPGMDARTRERALEQFFTTKASGSGLGLALVARVVEAHGGKLELHSQLGEGTRVAIELPGLPGASSRVT